VGDHVRYFLVVWGSKISFPEEDNQATTTNRVDKKENKNRVTLTNVGQNVTIYIETFQEAKFKSGFQNRIQKRFIPPGTIFFNPTQWVNNALDRPLYHHRHYLYISNFNCIF